MAVNKKHSDNFTRFVEDIINQKLEDIVDTMEYIGLQATEEMRRNHKYQVQTNNLASSTGFAVVANGKVVRGGTCTPAEGAAGGDAGAAQGTALMQNVAAEIDKDTIALILVAGMDYAIYVERMGLNVMDSAKTFANKEFNEMMVELGFTKG